MIRANLLLPDDATTYQKIKIRFNEALRNEFINNQNYKYYDNLDKFIEAIINEYVLLPFSKREKFYFKDTCEKINDAIKNKHVILIEFKNEKIDFCPYMIETDKCTNYNYLIGKPKDKTDQSKLYCYRLQHIRIISDKNISFKELSRKEIKEIKSIIERVGAPYVRGAEDCESKVKLTEQGYENYKMWINQRPKYTGSPQQTSDGSVILTFECSHRQIRNYFYKFGKEALVIEPKELKDQFTNDFKEALEKYTQ